MEAGYLSVSLVLCLVIWDGGGGWVEALKMLWGVWIRTCCSPIQKLESVCGAPFLHTLINEAEKCHLHQGFTCSSDILKYLWSRDILNRESFDLLGEKQRIILGIYFAAINMYLANSGTRCLSSHWSPPVLLLICCDPCNDGQSLGTAAGDDEGMGGESWLVTIHNGDYNRGDNRDTRRE